jgi:hypothetical protein
LQKKTVRLTMGVKPCSSCRALFKRLEILIVPYEYILSLINIITSNKEHFQANADVLTQGTSTISINQLLTSHAFRKVHTTLRSKFSIICYLISSLMKEKAQFKIALKRCLNTHAFYSVEYLVVKMIYPCKSCVNCI